MRSSTDEWQLRATTVSVTDDLLTVEFDDGRTISVPTQWYPRLRHGTAAERANVEIGRFGLSWPDLDEDISYRGLFLGNPSGENSQSIKFWLDNRRKGRKVTFLDWFNQRRTPMPRKGKRRGRVVSELR